MGVVRAKKSRLGTIGSFVVELVCAMVLAVIFVVFYLWLFAKS